MFLKSPKNLPGVVLVVVLPPPLVGSAAEASVVLRLVSDAAPCQLCGGSHVRQTHVRRDGRQTITLSSHPELKIAPWRRRERGWRRRGREIESLGLFLPPTRPCAASRRDFPLTPFIQTPTCCFFFNSLFYFGPGSTSLASKLSFGNFNTDRWEDCVFEWKK